MIRVIDDTGNHLAIPVNMDDPEVTSMIMENLKIDIILRDLRENSVEDVVSKLLELKLSDITDLLLIIAKVFEEASITLENQDKFGDLTKKLIHVLPSLLTRNKIISPRFKPRELIAIRFEREFWNVVKNEQPKMQFEVNKDHGMIMFLARLYNTDMMPDDRLYLMLVLLSSDQKRHKYVKLFLKQIKAKVIQEMSKPIARNQGTAKVYQFFVENKIIVDKKKAEGAEDKDKDEGSDSDDGLSTSVYESASDSERPSTSKAIKTPSKNKNSENDQQKTTKAAKSDSKITKTDTLNNSMDIVVLFEDHLNNLKAEKQSNFDIELFKSSTDDEKRICVQKLLTTALEDPNFPKKYAELIVSILHLSFPSLIDKRKLSFYLKKAFEEKIEILFKQARNDNADWNLLRSLGDFVAELYIVEVLKNSVLNKWLEEAKSLAIGSDIALKILLDSFKIYQSSMKRRNEKGYKNLIEFLKDRGQIPEEYAEWFNKLLTEDAEKSKPTSSTEIVKKMVPQTTSSPYQTCKKFQDYLKAIKANESTSYEEYKITDTSTEALQDCASIFLESCILEPEIADFYCDLLHSTILPALADEKQILFKKYLKFYIYTEMKTTVNLEKYDLSNWDRSGRLSCLICHLYKIGVVEMDLMDAWLDRLHLSTMSNYSESEREFQAALLISATIMGRRDPIHNTKKLLVYADGDKAKPVLRGPNMRKSKYLGEMIVDRNDTFMTYELQNFAFKIFDIENHDIEEVIKAFHAIEIENDKDFEKFHNLFFRLYSKCRYPSAFAAITKYLCLELKPFEFREKVTKLLCDELRKTIDSYIGSWDHSENDIDIIILVAAEFYNYGIITSQTYLSCLDKLVTDIKSPKPIFIFHISLFTVAQRLIHTGDGSDLEQIYHYFKTKPKGSSKHEFTKRYRQFLDHFDNVFEMSAVTVKESQKKLNFSFILDNLNENNFENSVKFVERLDVFKCKQNAGILNKKVLSDMNKLDIYIRFATEIAKFKYDFKESIVGSLIVEFGYVLGVSKDTPESTSMKPLKESEIPKVQNIIDYLIALYRGKLCTSEHLDFFLQFLCSDVCENRLKCVGYLLKIFGYRLQRVRYSMIAECFARISQNQKSEKYKILLSRIETLADNNFKFESDEDERSYMLAMGADWKINNEEKVEVVQKSKKVDEKNVKLGKRKIEKVDEKKSESESSEKSKNDEKANINQGETSKQNTEKERPKSSNAKEQEPTTSKKLTKKSAATNLDANKPSTSNSDRRGDEPSNLDQNQSKAKKNPQPSLPELASPQNQKILPQTSSPAPTPPIIPPPQDNKPLTPSQIKQNYEFFTKTESDFEVFVRNLENSSTNLITTCRKMAQKVTKSDDSQKEFLQNIWKYCLIDSSLAADTAEMCNKLAENQDNFGKNIEKFVKCRINSLLAIANATNVKEHEGVRKRMANALLFMAAVYSQDLISDKTFQSCAVNKLTSLLNCKEVADMLVIIAKKVNEDCEENIQLQAKILGLENLQEKKFSEVVGTIKDDLMAIKGI